MAGFDAKTEINDALLETNRFDAETKTNFSDISSSVLA